MDGTSARAALGLLPSADRHDVRRAFRAMAKRTHPDRGGDQELFVHLRHAYTVAVATAPLAPVAPQRHPFVSAETLPMGAGHTAEQCASAEHTMPFRSFAEELSEAMTG